MPDSSHSRIASLAPLSFHFLSTCAEPPPAPTSIDTRTWRLLHPYGSTHETGQSTGRMTSKHR